MIDAAALKLAALIKKASPEETTSIEIMAYALTVILNTVFVLAESLFIGWLTGKLYEAAIVFFALALLRLFSGGFHMPTTLGCNAVSVGVCTAVSHSAVFFQPWTSLLTFLSLVLVLAFSPVVDRHTRVSKVKYPLLKMISALIVSLNFFLHSDVIGLAFLIQAVTLVPMGRRRTV